MSNLSIRLKKRDHIPTIKALALRLAAIIFALIICSFVIISITHMNPVQIYGGVINGAIGTSRRAWVTIRDMLVLFLVAAGLVPAFKMKFWNIGAEGQILMGGLASAALMIYGSSLPNWLLLFFSIAASCIAGMVWAVIPAFFKAKYNTNETLFTLMMNYVAMQIITFCIVFWENPPGSNTVGVINSVTEKGWFPAIFGLKYGLNLILVVIVAVSITLYLKYTKHGYELTVVGESQDTARYAGIAVKKVIIRTMSLSGAVCGFAGNLIVSGASHTISTSLAGGRGFTAIIVAWMAEFNTWAMAAFATLLVFMENGAIQIASQFSLNENVSEILTGIIIFFLIGSEFFINYEVVLEKKEVL